MPMLMLMIMTVSLPIDVTITLPDTVEVDELIEVEITRTGGTGGSFSCIPVSDSCSSELQYRGTSTSSSYRSIITSGGRQVSSETTVTLSFTSNVPGIMTIGLFLTGTGMGNEIYRRSVVVEGDQEVISTTNQPELRELIENAEFWMEVEYDIDGLLYPGISFETIYYICSKYPSVDFHATETFPSEYISERVIDQAEYLEFRRMPKGYYRADIMTIEFTAIFPCTVSLPRMQNTVSRHSVLSPNPRVEIISPEIRLPVYPYPDEGMPDNFIWVGDSISFELERIFGSFSTAGEKNLRLYAFGSGASGVDSMPELTFTGPVELSCSDRQDSGSSIYWDIMVHPTDSGIVLIGPDSVAWFDREEHRYKQAVISKCTFEVRAPVGVLSSPALPVKWDRKLPVIFWIILSGVILTTIAVYVFYLKRKKSRGGGLESASDPEELLTALERGITELFFGKPRWISYDELDELLSDKNIDRMFTRRILRHWKNLELLLSKKITDEELNRLRQKTIDILAELHQ